MSGQVIHGLDSWMKQMDQEAKASYAADHMRYVPTTMTPSMTKTDESRQTHYSSIEDDGTVVTLGDKAIADAQRDADEAAGGLVALMFARMSR